MTAPNVVDKNDRGAISREMNAAEHATVSRRGAGER
jgi:hypothetical protein